MLVLLAFAAIVTTLSVHQNRPLPQWPSMISINSLISVFTAILKAALILPVAEGKRDAVWRRTLVTEKQVSDS